MLDVDGDEAIRYWEFVRILGQATMERSEATTTTTSTGTTPLRPNQLPGESVFLPVATKKPVLSPGGVAKEDRSDAEVRALTGMILIAYDGRDSVHNCVVILLTMITISRYYHRC